MMIALGVFVRLMCVVCVVCLLCFVVVCVGGVDVHHQTTARRRCENVFEKVRFVSEMVQCRQTLSMCRQTLSMC